MKLRKRTFEVIVLDENDVFNFRRMLVLMRLVGLDKSEIQRYENCINNKEIPLDLLDVIIVSLKSLYRKLYELSRITAGQWSEFENLIVDPYIFAKQMKELRESQAEECNDFIEKLIRFKTV